ncbi:hypothetical protein HPP92_024886 [Vanilla planifolia]|uniref:Uncharacterized protein n=1 Tax=Vanilla planifolia TaxID=51239 RepID=A0A835PJ12_VANPL|nr:hypothetical protein HPP92_025171 [Vanilla planifolia]KAG0453582.1 hypothetical protein HPP92_024886 [Vanilla planifolia]
METGRVMRLMETKERDLLLAGQRGSVHAPPSVGAPAMEIDRHLVRPARPSPVLYHKIPREPSSVLKTTMSVLSSCTSPTTRGDQRRQPQSTFRKGRRRD